MDPQQRLLLELSYDAMHSAAYRRAQLKGCDVGVFVGLMNTDFASLAGSENVYAATGTQVSITSGRLAFTLHTQGPCASIDTACSSALVSLHTAALAVRAGECGGGRALAQAGLGGGGGITTVRQRGYRFTLDTLPAS